MEKSDVLRRTGAAVPAAPVSIGSQFARPRRRNVRQGRRFVWVLLVIAWLAASGAFAAESSGASPGERDPAKQIDEKQQQLFQKTVTAARLAMSRRDPLGGRRHAQSAMKLAQSPEEEAEAARLDVLAQYLEEFWKTMSQVIRDLTPAQEFNAGGTPLIVVETSPTHVTFRSEGRNRTYAIKDLPLAVVEALVQGGFADNIDTKLLFGAYLAMDAQGDRQAARKLWQEAIAAGKDVSDLMLELNGGPVAKGSREATSSKMPKQGQPGARDSNSRDIPTDPNELRKAEQVLREQFEIDRNLASSVGGKLKLAEKLVRAAGAAEVPEAVRYVMLRDARDYALAAGKPAAACEAIDRMAEYFSVDALELKIAALEQLAKTLRTASGGKETVDCALKLADEAFRERQIDEAERLVAVAVSMAQRTKSVALLQKARAAEFEIQRAAKSAKKPEKRKTSK